MIDIVEKKLSLIVLVDFAVIKYLDKNKGEKKSLSDLQFLRECGPAWWGWSDMAVRKQND